MLYGKKVVAIIPARGGSKRLPNKNLLLLKGKPLISWTIEAAKGCHYIDEVVVTSDSVDILDVGRSAGVTCISRPENLSGDKSTTYSALIHALESLNEEFEILVLLQPTSPLRTVEHISEALELYYSKNASSVVSVTECDHSPLWCNTISESLSLDNFIKEEFLSVRSQDLPTYFRLNGAIYIASVEDYLREETFMLKKNTFAYKMDKNKSVDIDDAIDLALAKTLLEADI